jgi:RNA polymerase sigma-70 factor (ECF subfamily)
MYRCGLNTSYAAGRPMPGEPRNGREEEGVERAFLAVWETGRTAWPGVALRKEDLFAYLTERTERQAAPPAAALEGADVYLVCACLRGVPRAIETFERTQMAPLRKVLERHVAIEPELLEDVLQALRADLFARGSRPSKLLSYSGRGKVRAWLTTIALRAAREANASESAAHPSLGSTVAVDIETPELQVVKAAHREPFRVAFADAMTSLSVRERNLLRMHLLDGLNADRIGVIYDVHRATAARWIRTARMKLVTQTRDLLMERLGLSRSAISSLVRGLQSSLDLSISRNLRGERPEG